MSPEHLFFFVGIEDIRKVIQGKHDATLEGILLFVFLVKTLAMVAASHNGAKD